MLSIDTLQKKLIQEFATLRGEPTWLLDHLIDLGEKMETLPEADKIDKHLVPGCLAKVWLVQKKISGCLWLRADSNAAITKGLISLLVRIFSGQPLQDIVHARIFFMDESGLNQLIGVQRNSGFEHMLKKIKQDAAKGCVYQAGLS